MSGGENDLNRIGRAVGESRVSFVLRWLSDISHCSLSLGDVVGNTQSDSGMRSDSVRTELIVLGEVFLNGRSGLHPMRSDQSTSNRGEREESAYLLI